MKIISLVPSFTELLFDLNLGAEVIGVTRFCIHPKEKTRLITKIGGTKSLKIERILDLKPDLIIANKEENSKEDILQLQQLANVWVTEIVTFQDALDVISELGERANRVSESKKMVLEIQKEFKNLPNFPHRSVAYFIWEGPIMLAGKNTFINEMLAKIGLTNIITNPDSRYPVQTEEELQELNPEFIFLSSEPFPFKEKQLPRYQKVFPNSKVILIDGEMFSWYGSRMKLAPTYFQQLMHVLN